MWIIEDIGLIDYQEACEYQQSLVKQKQEGCSDNFFLLLEHPPVFTRGKSAKDSNIIDKDIPVHSTGRGGDMTYHEPGQLVGYIILDLMKEKLKVRDFVASLEDMLINTLKKTGVKAYRKPDLIGVWVEEKKIASVGIAIKKGVTMHGFSLNINNELEGFKKINACGLEAKIFSSLKHLKGEEQDFEPLKKIVLNEFIKTFAVKDYKLLCNKQNS